MIHFEHILWFDLRYSYLFHVLDYLLLLRKLHHHDDLELILDNKDIIFDATSITPSVRKRFIDSLKELGIDRNMYEIYVYYFIPDVELSKERIQRRNEIGIERYMPLEVIEKYNNEIIPPTKEEGFDKILFISSDDFSIKNTL